MGTMNHDAERVQRELDTFKREMEKKTTALQSFLAEAIQEGAQLEERVTALERRLANQCGSCGNVPQRPGEDHECAP